MSNVVFLYYHLEMSHLYDYQREGVSWMINQEVQSRFRGGILGDDMGLGKTVQAIALINERKEAVKPTLVCVPASIILQWFDELERFGDSLSIFVFHGSQKVMV